ncbi:PAS domain-containing protein [Stenotrophomonas sp. JAI102]|uniref:PAS domain-containing hybrid sensor histidine kinase/response regulator n=1 Tax=Stenotrophomonas sp. JAI102 TaxID=2723077 RepID=UPI00179404CD|nr:PAS domain-containing protein [Stenotrophomonas sp. JAI102]NYF36251.1 PAS domain S-box-containing protein [Stenotrophomonas sp. JAI102]
MSSSPSPGSHGERDAERVRMALAAGAIIGTWFWDVAQDSLTVDDALALAHGLDPALARTELRLDQVVSAVHPEDRAGLAEAIAEAVRRGGRYAHQYRTRGADGAYRWIEAIGRVDLDAHGQAVSFPGVLIDIDERRRIEAERDQAQTLLRSFVEAAPGVLYAKDRQGRMLIGNRGTTELIGLPPEIYVGRTDAELLGDPAQAAIVMATDERVMASGQTEQLEEEVSFPDGRRAHWLSTKSPLRDADGVVVGLVGTSLDITDRKAAEARHLEAEERYRLAAQATNDAIWDWRISDGQVIWNEALTTLFGHALRETSAQWWLDHIHPDDRARVDRDIHAVIEGGGTAWNSEYRFRRADGSFASVLDRGTVLRGSVGEPLRMIGAMLDLTVRQAAEAALAQSEERLRLATEAGDMGFWDVDLVRDALIWPARTKAMFGISPEVAVSMRDFHDGLHPDDRAATVAAFAAAADPARRALYDVEYRTVGKEDGVVRWVAAKGRGHFEGDRCVRVVGVAIEITARKLADARLQELNEHLESRVLEEVAQRTRVEDALRQSQKMEAVGQLTGGIAHDFNNMLATVIGPLDLLAMRMGDSDPRAKRYIDMAIDGATRAAQLTQRLLAFSRQQPLQPVPLDVNRLIAGMSDLLVHSLGSSIRLETVLAAQVWCTFADANQLENVILNLAVNARDALPGGGRLVVETANCTIADDDDAAAAEVPVGEYVRITVADNGSGMPPEVIAKAFDPFFTTKKVGQGTGLGLSQVYGFVKQSAGHVNIDSTPGQGTTVTLYLPRRRVDVAPSPPAGREDHRALSGGRELVLVVEDEPGVRQFSIDALTELGYPVLAAEGAAMALTLLDRHPDIALLFTDVVMPEVNGRQLADEALRRRPTLKVLFTTGYSRNALENDGVLDPDVHLIGKPFTLEELALRVRAVLAEVR